MTRYFNSAIASLMFPSDCTLVKKQIAVKAVQNIFDNSINVYPSSFEATIAAINSKFGLDLSTGSSSAIELVEGDSVLVTEIKGLGRLNPGELYSDEQITNSIITFALYTVAPNNEAIQYAIETITTAGVLS